MLSACHVNGYALMVRHVDDKVMIVTNLKIMDYMVDTLRVAWVCKYTGWRKVLGWDAVIDRDDRTITFECPCARHPVAPREAAHRGVRPGAQ